MRIAVFAAVMRAGSEKARSVAFQPLIYDVKASDDLGYPYAYQHWPLVRAQLLKGGVRLAAVLNEVFR